jgi:hypothetical protein
MRYSPTTITPRSRGATVARTQRSAVGPRRDGVDGTPSAAYLRRLGVQPAAWPLLGSEAVGRHDRDVGSPGAPPGPLP